ncbi:gibberellin 2-beta-dioxygenase 8 isoform X1 [Primulina tabacum]|uniref:gibberellin 2-beta-dioxygenase 8 isoform X1 n=1 Tax=Primulina tabacum TaxID=48773 RepID=UPI003F5A1A21
MVLSLNRSKYLNNLVRMEESPDPPFEQTYRNLFNSILKEKNIPTDPPVMEECQLPLIDLNRLNLGDFEKQACKKDISRASKEWGFFQVINHGISAEILERMRHEQIKLFKKPFHEKTNSKDLNFSTGSYRWGTPSATCLRQLSWSEAFHVLLSDILGSGGYNNLSSTMEQFAAMVSELAQKLVDLLAEELGCKSDYFKETCLPSTCYLRLNRYPRCPSYPDMFGIMPHTDSDFLTVLHQDHIGGLQLVKDGKWIAVRPNPEALIINIGDLFQAWSNNVYKSVEHRVVTNAEKERFSTAYFFCPSYYTIIESNMEPRVYRSFRFGEYREQVQEDVKRLGYKVGLPNFLLNSSLDRS